jgi:predicted lipid-binding transport protein (Tim44 family)
MELLVATWTLRLALVGSMAVAAISISAGATIIDAVERAVIAAFALTLLGRMLIGWLQTPEQRMLKLRRRREAARRKGTAPDEQKRSHQTAHAPKRAPALDGPSSSTS